MAYNDFIEMVLGDGTCKVTDYGMTVTPRSIDDFYSKGIYQHDGIDLITTLENYLDHKWLRENELIIVNDSTIYDTPLGVLTYGSFLYDYVAKHYNFL